MNEARWWPILEVCHETAPEAKADGFVFFERNGAPDILAVCHQHKEEAKVEDFITDESWAKLQDAFQMAGKARPTRGLTTLNWRLIPREEPTT